MRKKKESQADRMLDAASRLFGGCPFHEVRMEDIAAEANVGKGTIYRYFASKDELYLKLVERAAKEYRLVIRTAADQPTSCTNRLIAITQMNIDFFKSQPRLLDLIQRAEVERGRGPEFPWHEARLEFYTLVTELFRDGMSKGEFVITDPHLVALLLGGGIRAFLLHGSIQCSTDLAEKAVGSLIGKVCHDRGNGNKLRYSNPN